MVTYQESMEELLRLQEEIKVLENKKSTEEKGNGFQTPSRSSAIPMTI